jgi:FkbM family methyltransferase
MDTSTILKKILKPTLRALNLRLQHYDTPSLNWETFFEELKGRGFTPDTIIDVGVGWGTPDLYDAFPKASYILVEPLREFEPALRTLSKKLKVQAVINSAAGAAPGKITMYVGTLPTHSGEFGSLLADKGDPYDMAGSYDVEVVRLDQAIKLKQGNALLKVDVEGAELNVVEGCIGILDRIDMVILETSLISRDEKIPEFFDVINYMNAKGFVVYSIIGGVKRPSDHALGMVDLVFVPKNHLLLRNRRWSTTDRA